MNTWNESAKREALMKMYEGTKHTEIAEEFILPDYLPDVRRIIRADAKPRLDGKFVSRGKVEYEGEVSCRILFIDEENKLRSVSFNLPFADAVEIPAVEEECIANLLPTPQSLSCRMVNPRRVAIRMRLDTEATVWCPCSFKPQFMGEPCNTEVKEETLSVLKLICAGENGLSAAADLEADGALPQIGEVVSCDVDISFYECKGADGKVLCRGDMPINIFYSTPGEGGESYTVLFRKLPLAQVIAAEGVDESYECTARGSVEDVKVTVSENGFGERRILELDITYRVYLNCVGNDSVTVVRDAYAPKSDVKTETETRTFCNFIRNYSTTFSANHSVEKKDVTLTDADSVLSVTAQPKVDRVTLDPDNRKLVVEGSASASAVLNGADGLGCADYEVPFRLEVEASGVPEQFTFNADVVCMSARGRTDEEKLYTDLELQINLMILGTAEQEILRQAEFQAIADEESVPQLRFFYPAEGETLWDVGRAFGVSQESLAAANQVSGSVLPPVLIIPRK